MDEFKSTIIERLADLLKSGEYSDTQFLLSNGEVVKGHKVIFAVSSPVFAAMLYGDIAEKGTVNIEDIEPEGFKTMTEFIYTDNLKLNSVGHAMSVYEAGHKYDVPNLEKLSKEYIKLNVDVDNALEVLEFSKLHEDSEIKTATMEMVVDKTNSVLNSKHSLNCNIDTLETLANEEKISTAPLEFFSFIDKWAKQRAETDGVSLKNIRPVLDNVIHKVRFLSMTVSDFLVMTCQSELLTAEEKVSLMLNIREPGSVPLPDGFCELTEIKEDFWCNYSSHLIIRWKVKDISKNQLSPKFYIGDYPFKILFYPYTDKNDIKQLGLYLQCDCTTETHGNDWSCNVDYVLRILRKEGKPFEISLSHIFKKIESIGRQVKRWTELHDEGFIEDNCIVIEAEVKFNLKKMSLRIK